jgi:hypothetical protein
MPTDFEVIFIGEQFACKKKLKVTKVIQQKREDNENV